MQMKDRHFVEGTDPAIYIGHRIIRRPGGKVSVSKSYHAEFTIESRQRSKSLGSANRAVAIRAAHALSDQLRQGIEIKPIKKASVAEIAEAYLAVQANRGRADRTMGKYRHNLREFAHWWDQRDGRPAVKVTEADFWAFRNWLKEEQKTDQTIEDRLIIVKQLFKWAAGKGKLMPLNPLVDATVPEPPPTPQPCFSPQQIEKLLQLATPHERAVFALMAYTGLRVGEVVALRWQDILFDQGEHGYVHVQRGGSNGTTKGKRSRRVPIHPVLRGLLCSLPRDYDTVFVRPRHSRYPNEGRPLNARQLLGAIKRLCQKCGFSNPEQYKIHTFRHAFASMCARTQISTKYALAWMGHKDSQILDMYIEIFDDAADRAMGTINYEARTSSD